LATALTKQGRITEAAAERQKADALTAKKSIGALCSLSPDESKAVSVLSQSQRAWCFLFADVLRLGTPPWKRDAVAAQQAPASRPGAQQSPTMRSPCRPARTGIAIAGTPLGVQFCRRGNAERLNAKTIFGRRRKKTKYLLGDDRLRRRLLRLRSGRMARYFLVNGWRLEGFPAEHEALMPLVPEQS